MSYTPTEKIGTLTDDEAVAFLDEPWTGRQYYDFVGDDRYERCYRDLLVEFAAAIREDREPSPNADDGYKALEWILGAYESHRTGQRVNFPLPLTSLTGTTHLSGATS